MKSKRGGEESNRAKRYLLRRTGRKQIDVEAKNGERMAGTLARFRSPSNRETT